MRLLVHLWLLHGRGGLVLAVPLPSVVQVALVAIEALACRSGHLGCSRRGRDAWTLRRVLQGEFDGDNLVDGEILKP